MAFQAVIFDLDGTLLNTLDDLAASVNYALQKFHKPLRTVEEVRGFVGNGIAKLIERAVPDGTDKPQQEEILQTFREYYGQHCQDKTAPYEGIKEVLRDLKQNKINIAVVSNKADFAVKKLIPFYFGDLIAIAKGEDEAAGIRKKPAPDMVQSVLEELGCSQEEAVYVGDSEVDLMTAGNAGLSFVGVSWGFKGRAFLEKYGLEKIADEPKELYKFVY